MKIEIKNSSFQPRQIKPLLSYLQSMDDFSAWEHNGLTVEIDPTIDFKGDNALIRWTDTQEGFNDKVIVNSLKEFTSIFQPVYA
ncbi:MAG: hypothetical protein ACK4R6_01130 [Spirosomataceae bacterium]